MSSIANEDFVFAMELIASVKSKNCARFFRLLASDRASYLQARRPPSSRAVRALVPCVETRNKTETET